MEGPASCATGGRVTEEAASGLADEVRWVGTIIGVSGGGGGHLSILEACSNQAISSHPSVRLLEV